MWEMAREKWFLVVLLTIFYVSVFKVGAKGISEVPSSPPYPALPAHNFETSPIKNKQLTTATEVFFITQTHPR